MEINYYLLALVSDCLYLSEFMKSIVWPEVIPNNSCKP